MVVTSCYLHTFWKGMAEEVGVQSISIYAIYGGFNLDLPQFLPHFVRSARMLWLEHLCEL